MYTGSGLGDPLGLNGLWTAAEFNIFGDANSSNANFSAGTTFNVWIDIGGGATCTTPATGITAETNNLTAVKGDEGPCCAWTMPGGHGGIQFTQSNAGRHEIHLRRSRLLHQGRRRVLCRRRGLLRHLRRALLQQRPLRPRPAGYGLQRDAAAEPDVLVLMALLRQQLGLRGMSVTAEMRQS